MRDLLRQAAIIAVLALLASGLYAWPTSAGTLGHFQALQLQQVAGWATPVLGLPALFLHLQETKGRLLAPLLVLTLGLVVTLLAN